MVASICSVVWPQASCKRRKATSSRSISASSLAVMLSVSCARRSARLSGLSGGVSVILERITFSIIIPYSLLQSKNPKNLSMSDLKGLAGHLSNGWNTFEMQFRTGLEIGLS